VKLVTLQHVFSDITYPPIVSVEKQWGDREYGVTNLLWFVMGWVRVMGGFGPLF